MTDSHQENLVGELICRYVGRVKLLCLAPTLIEFSALLWIQKLEGFESGSHQDQSWQYYRYLHHKIWLNAYDLKNFAIIKSPKTTLDHLVTLTHPILLSTFDLRSVLRLFSVLLKNKLSKQNVLRLSFTDRLSTPERFIINMSRPPYAKVLTNKYPIR